MGALGIVLMDPEPHGCTKNVSVGWSQSKRTAHRSLGWSCLTDKGMHSSAVRPCE
jgi:hypothetical protein